MYSKYKIHFETESNTKYKLHAMYLKYVHVIQILNCIHLIHNPGFATFKLLEMSTARSFSVVITSS